MKHRFGQAVGVCGAISVAVALWLAAALISDLRELQSDLRREARGRHPSSGKWLVDQRIGKPSAGDNFPALGDLPNP
ncbi:hypothetical protein [Nocardia sp. NPDC046763]|uniref:hypothetical protein n=1 Tax=Nocardia sp. NPDC046763 TaxID=3155256 RepID=UPI0033DA3860